MPSRSKENPGLDPRIEGKAVRERLTIGGFTPRDQIQMLQHAGVFVSMEAGLMIEGPDYPTLPEPREIDLVRLSIKDLGIEFKNPTNANIDEKIAELGLKKLPAEVAFYYRMAHLDQPQGEGVLIGMEPITVMSDRLLEDSPHVFVVGNSERLGLFLHGYFGHPHAKWTPEGQILLGI